VTSNQVERRKSGQAGERIPMASEAAWHAGHRLGCGSRLWGNEYLNAQTGKKLLNFVVRCPQRFKF
jgi:hypothetical protein